MRHSRDPAPWLIFALALVSLGAPLLVFRHYDLATQFEDDAFYYFQIAKNVVQGRGFTFDGIHPTNGFHPLWLMALLPIFGSFPGLDAPVRAAGVLEAALLGITGAIVYCVLRARSGRLTAALAGVLVFALPGTRNMQRVGLESALSVCLLAATWHAWVRLDRARLRSWAWLGAVCGLAALARLEALSALAVLIWFERAHLTREFRAAGALVLPPACAVGAYLVWSFVSFGVWLPISGTVKHFWAATYAYQLPLGIHVPRGLPASVAATLLLGVALAFMQRLQPKWVASLREQGFALPAITAACMLCADYVAFWHIQHWYLAPVVLCVAVMAATWIGQHQRLCRFALIAATLGAVTRVPATVHAVRNNLYQAHLRGEAAGWLRAHLPPNTRVGAWNGGMLGYYSGVHVVMLDGLANSPAFFRRAMLGADLGGFLRDEHIDHLVTLGCRLDQVLWTDLPVDPTGGIVRSYELQRPLTDRPVAHPCADSPVLWSKR